MLYLAWTNLQQRMLRTLVALLSITVGIWLAMMLRGVSQGTLASSLDELRNLDRFMMVRTPGPIFRLGQGVIDHDPVMVKTIQETPGVQAVMPFRFFLQEFTPDLVGVAAAFPVTATPALQELFPVVKGSTIDAPGQAVVEFGLADLLKLEVGQTFTLNGLGTFLVKGHFRATTNIATAQLILDLETVSKTLNDSRIQGMFVTVNRSDDLQPVKVAIEKGYPKLIAEPLTMMAETLGSALLRFDQLVNLIFWMSVTVAALICGLVLLSMVSEQRRDIGILKAMGASDRAVLTLILGQALILGLTGAVIGAGLAWLVKETIIPHFFPSLHMDFNLRWFMEALISGVGAGTLGAMGATYYALQVDPVEVLTYE